MKRLLLATFISVSLLAASQTSCYTVKSGLFCDQSTWSGGNVPDSTVNISVSAGDTLIVTSPCCVKNVFICGGAVLKVDSGKCFTVCGDFTNNGVFTGSNSLVRFCGNTSQNLGGSTVTEFSNLEVYKSGTLFLNKDVRLRKLMTIESGTVQTTNNQKIILLSDINGTAGIGPLLNGADIKGRVTVQRYLKSPVTGWRFLGSPVRTRLNDWAADFVTSGFPGSAYPSFYFCSIYRYNETAPGTSENGYYPPTHVTDSLLPGNGYWCWVGPTPRVVDVTGAPFKGIHQFHVNFTPSGGKGHDGWNMLANPYPCAIDWDSPAWTKTGIQNAIYIWDPETEQYSTYINGVGINGGSNIIPSSTAFWLQANQSSPLLSSTEEVKTTLNVHTQKIPAGSVLRFAVKSSNGRDEAVLGFRSTASMSVDPAEDAVKLFSDNPQVPSLSLLNDSTDLAVSFLPFLNSAVIPLKLTTAAAGIYTISASGIQFPENRCIYLEDPLTGNTYDLRTAVQFTCFISASSRTRSFFIHMKKPLEAASVTPRCSYSHDGKIIVSNSEGSALYTWKDANGNVLAAHTGSAGADSLLNLGAGMYVVHVANVNPACSNLEETVVVEAREAIKLNSGVLSNMCPAGSTGKISITEVSGGTAPYLLRWNDGAEGGIRMNMPAGVYHLITTDANHCRDTSYFSVGTLSSLSADFSSTFSLDSVPQFSTVKFINSSQGHLSANWTLNSQSLPQNDPVIAFNTPGEYTIALVVKDERCEMEKSAQVKVISRQLDEPATDILIYENSGEAVIQLAGEPAGDQEVRVVASDGKLVYSGTLQFSRNRAVVPLGSANGVYIVTVYNSVSSHSSKIIKN